MLSSISFNMIIFRRQKRLRLKSFAFLLFSFGLLPPSLTLDVLLYAFGSSRSFLSQNFASLSSLRSRSARCSASPSAALPHLAPRMLGLRWTKILQDNRKPKRGGVLVSPLICYKSVFRRQKIKVEKLCFSSF